MLRPPTAGAVVAVVVVVIASSARSSVFEPHPTKAETTVAAASAENLFVLLLIGASPSTAGTSGGTRRLSGRTVATDSRFRYQPGLSAVDGYQRSNDARMVAIMVLGPTRVEGTDTLSPRDRVVLGVLVASRRVTVTPDQLAAALWGEEVPESWRKVVQTVVMRLRKILGAQAIETTSSGYMLTLAPGDVDAWRFADVIDHARELVALGELDRAVYAFDDAPRPVARRPLSGSRTLADRRGRGGSARGAAPACRGAAPRGARGARTRRRK